VSSLDLLAPFGALLTRHCSHDGDGTTVDRR
jgi:hypothetical protein